MAQISEEVPGDERGTLLTFVEAQRRAIRETLEGLTEEQAASRPSASELSLSGVLKHVAEMELGWLRMAQQRENEILGSRENYADGFRLLGDETVAGMLAFWDGVRAETEAFIAAVPSLDDSFPLPPAPWFPENGKVSMRWMLLHLVEEIARHAGHADIIRESLDGTKAMG
ncbi:DinB family protein [Streptomyces sp. NBC_00091]|uniref:DinB family protein n=1 Tax=Streptomyces sp. NBC_00091 TaxID=2975648 RepID=UPI00224EA026|nr:DinB family protein [Streptomyces sp. NBC_00091]MCX5377594.1 DinB family protein [Streptomyces sp. NBC_00091]